MRKNFLIAFVGLLWIIFPADLFGQMFSHNAERVEKRASQSLTFGYQVEDFSYQGTAFRALPLDFSAPVYGLTYRRQFLRMSVAYGLTSGDSIHVTDVSLTTFRPVFRVLEGDNNRIFVSGLVEFSYRNLGEKEQRTTAINSFSIGTIGGGGGLTYQGQAGKASWQLHAAPFIALALLRDQSGGYTRGIDTEFIFDLDNLFGSVGLSIGAGWRFQEWFINTQDITNNVNDKLYDYKSIKTLFFVGVNW